MEKQILEDYINSTGIRECEPGEFQLQLQVQTPSSALQVYNTWSRTSRLLGSPTPTPTQKKVN